MRWPVDLIYAVLAVLTAPVWLTRMIRTGKIRTDWGGRFGRGAEMAEELAEEKAEGLAEGIAADPAGHAHPARVLIHAVSVGEINAIRLLVGGLVASSTPPPQIVIATTTDTGFRRARDLFGRDHPVVRYPFDFSFAVRRFLDRVRPDVVVLVELEVWPNFTHVCASRGIPVCVVNGRLTARSARRYRRVLPLVRPSFRRLARAAVQNGEYAARFRALGVDAARIAVTGTMKWDTAMIADQVDGAGELANELGIDRTRPLVVAGSTAPDEIALIRNAVPEGVQLLCAPRKPEWFDAAAADLRGCVRRTRPDAAPAGGASTDRFLLDTIGELRMAYALADLVIVGRSFGALHGSDMIEPVALGKPTIVGPAVADFQDAADALGAGNGLVRTTADALPRVVRDLLDDAERRCALAANGRAVIRERQGATARHVDLVRSLLGIR